MYKCVWRGVREGGVGQGSSGSHPGDAVALGDDVLLLLSLIVACMLQMQSIVQTPCLSSAVPLHHPPCHPGAPPPCSRCPTACHGLVWCEVDDTCHRCTHSRDGRRKMRGQCSPCSRSSSATVQQQQCSCTELVAGRASRRHGVYHVGQAAIFRLRSPCHHDMKSGTGVCAPPGSLVTGTEASAECM